MFHFKNHIKINKSQYLVSLYHLAIWSITAFLIGIRIPYQDSAFYQVYAPTSFYKNNHFSIFNFRNVLRGYLLPFISVVIKKFSSIVHIDFNIGILIFNIILFTLLTSYLLPKVIKLVFNIENSLLLSSPLLIFMIIFFRGYLPYLMSDFTSTIFFLSAIIFIFDRPSKIKIILAGLPCSAAMNIRMSFILALPTLIIIMFINEYIKGKVNNLTIKGYFKNILVISSLFFIGFISVGFTQIIINHRTDASYGMFPQGKVPGLPNRFPTDTVLIPLGNSDITTFQLSVGLALQRYETRLIKDKNPAMYFHDAEGEKLVSKYLPIYGVKGYLSIWKHEPITMTKINTRHVLNGFDHTYSGPFPTGSEKINLTFKLLWYFIIGFTLLTFIINLLLILLKRNKLFNSKNLLAISILTLSTFITTIPSAIEPRFFIYPTLILFTLFIGLVKNQYKELLNKKEIYIPIILISMLFAYGYIVFSNGVHATIGPLNHNF